MNYLSFAILRCLVLFCFFKRSDTYNVTMKQQKSVTCGVFEFSSRKLMFYKQLKLVITKYDKVSFLLISDNI